MRQPSEAPTTASRLWHDTGTFCVLAFVGVPLYLVLNQYWQTFVLLVVCYGLFCLFCARLGGYTRRVLRRLPAEIPPWHAGWVSAPLPQGVERHWSTAEAMQSVRRDPHYVQEVLKPRLRHMLAYRVTGRIEASFAELDPGQLAQLDPVLLALLQRQEPTHWWACYRQRQQRVDLALEMCQRLEGV